MDERRRHSVVLGETSLACPYCGGGPMVVIRSERTRPLWQRLNPGFDPDVLHHEVCTACAASFLVGPERSAAVRTGAAPDDPAPDVAPRQSPPPEPEPEPEPETEPAQEPEAEPVVRPVAAAHQAGPAPVLAAPPPIRRRSPLGSGRRPGPGTWGSRRG